MRRDGRAAALRGNVNDVTHLLKALDRGDAQAAGRLLPLVYDEQRRLAAHRLAQEKFCFTACRRLCKLCQRQQVTSAGDIDA